MSTLRVARGSTAPWVIRLADGNADLNTHDVDEARIVVPELGLELASGTGGEIAIESGRLVVTLTQEQADGLTLGRYRAHGALHFQATDTWVSLDLWSVEVMDNPAIHEPEDEP